MVVYAGNQRLRGLLSLGYKEVPDNWLDIEDNIPESLMRSRALKDNVEYGEWDYKILQAHFTLDELVALNIPITELDLNKISRIKKSQEEREDDIPFTTKTAIVKTGDIFEL